MSPGTPPAQVRACCAPRRLKLRQTREYLQGGKQVRKHWGVMPLKVTGFPKWDASSMQSQLQTCHSSWRRCMRNSDLLLHFQRTLSCFAAYSSAHIHARQKRLPSLTLRKPLSEFGQGFRNPWQSTSVLTASPREARNVYLCLYTRCFL